MVAAKEVTSSTTPKCQANSADSSSEGGAFQNVDVYDSGGGGDQNDSGSGIGNGDICTDRNVGGGSDVMVVVVVVVVMEATMRLW